MTDIAHDEEEHRPPPEPDRSPELVTTVILPLEDVVTRPSAQKLGWSVVEAAVDEPRHYGVLGTVPRPARNLVHGVVGATLVLAILIAGTLCVTAFSLLTGAVFERGGLPWS